MGRWKKKKNVYSTNDTEKIQLRLKESLAWKPQNDGKVIKGNHKVLNDDGKALKGDEEEPPHGPSTRTLPSPSTASGKLSTPLIALQCF